MIRSATLQTILTLISFFPSSGQVTAVFTMPIGGLDPNEYNGTVAGPYTTVWQGNYNNGPEGSDPGRADGWARGWRDHLDL